MFKVQSLTVDGWLETSAISVQTGDEFKMYKDMTSLERANTILEYTKLSDQNPSLDIFFAGQALKFVNSDPKLYSADEEKTIRERFGLDESPQVEMNSIMEELETSVIKVKKHMKDALNTAQSFFLHDCLLSIQQKNANDHLKTENTQLKTENTQLKKALKNEKGKRQRISNDCNPLSLLTVCAVADAYTNVQAAQAKQIDELTKSLNNLERLYQDKCLEVTRLTKMNGILLDKQ